MVKYYYRLNLLKITCWTERKTKWGDYCCG